MDRLQQTQPLTPSDLSTALTNLHEAGWTFEYSGRLSIVPRADAEQDYETLESVRKKYARLPIEIAEICWCILSGDSPRNIHLGSDEDIKQKSEIVSRSILNRLSRERFFLHQCGKIPMYGDLDWEVAIKVAEHGITTAPHFPYALVSLQTVLPGDDDTESIEFTIGLEGLRRLAAEIGELQTHIEAVSRAQETHLDMDADNA